MSVWHSIDSAPKDGSTVKVRNEQIANWRPPYVEAKYGDYYSGVTKKTYPDTWVLVRDYTAVMPMPAGTMVCPTEWYSETK